MNLTKRYLADLGERLILAFLGAYAAAWQLVGVSDYQHLFTLHNLQSGLVGAAVVFFAGVVGKNIGNPVSASVLPPSLQPPAPIPADPDPEAPAVVATPDWQPPYVPPEMP